MPNKLFYSFYISLNFITYFVDSQGFFYLHFPNCITLQIEHYTETGSLIMFNLPDQIIKEYDKLLTQQSIELRKHNLYLKWLRFYLDLS